MSQDVSGCTAEYPTCALMQRSYAVFHWSGGVGKWNVAARRNGHAHSHICYGFDGNCSSGYSSVEPASPKIPRPGDRSRISTTWAKGPGSKGGPGLWAFRSL